MNKFAKKTNTCTHPFPHIHINIIPFCPLRWAMIIISSVE